MQFELKNTVGAYNSLNDLLSLAQIFQPLPSQNIKERLLKLTLFGMLLSFREASSWA